MKERIRGLLEAGRLKAAARWLAPVAVTGVLAVLLTPGFASREVDDTRTQESATARTDVLDASSRFELTPAPDDVEAEEYASLDPDGLDETEGATRAHAADEPDAEAQAEVPLDCIIEPFEVVELGSPVTGVIESIQVERGDLVEAGQVVAELESTVEKAAVEVARARAKMAGEVKSREARVELGEKRQERAHELFDRNALSLDQREQLETEARLARLELQQARENRRLASLELDQALEALKRRRIRSPVSGVVVDRLMSPGEVVDEETILTIAQIDPLRVEVVLPAARFGSVETGMRAAVVPEFPGDKVHVASVKIVDRLIDAASGTFRVGLELPNPDHAIPGGLHCEVRFLDDD